MLRTEQLSSYSRHTDYFQLWLEKKKEVQKLEINLLDSKKVIRTLHLKLTDILKSIKVFEANQDLSTTNQEKEENYAINNSVLLNDPIIRREMEVEGHSCIFQGNTTELVKGNCDQINLTENADLPLQVNAFSVMSDSFPKPTDVQKPESQDAAYTAVPVDVRSVSGEEVKYEQCDATGDINELLGEVISDQEFQTENVDTYPEIQPDRIHSGLTFEVEDNQLKDEIEQNSETDFQAAPEVSSEGTPEDCGILSMNVFESYKSEPMEELNNNEDMSIQVVMPSYVTSFDKKGNTSQNSQDEVLEAARKKIPRIQKDCLSDTTMPATELSILSQDKQQSPSSKDDLSEINEILLECSQCHKKFKSKADTKKQHKKGILVSICGSCQCKTRNSKHYLSKKMKHTCEICGKTFTCADFLGLHNLSHQNNISASDNVLAKDQCFRVHNISQNRGKVRRCEVSVKKIVLNQYPIINKPSNTYLKSHKCSICGRCFFTSRGLRKHCHVSHLEQTSRKCKICNKIFDCASALEIHIRTHTGEKPYECKVCGKKFINTSNLKDHEFVHSVLKPHKCPICGRCFKRLREMKNHLAVHTGDKPFECAICKKKFLQAGNLRTHLRIHTGEKPYQCDICSEVFSSYSHFIYHQRTRHVI